MLQKHSVYLNWPNKGLGEGPKVWAVQKEIRDKSALGLFELLKKITLL